MAKTVIYTNNLPWHTGPNKGDCVPPNTELGTIVLKEIEGVSLNAQMLANGLSTGRFVALTEEAVADIERTKKPMVKKQPAPAVVDD